MHVVSRIMNPADMAMDAAVSSALQTGDSAPIHKALELGADVHFRRYHSDGATALGLP